MPEVPKYIQYYYKEDTNQILVSGSATASDPLTVSKMNTLLNASKNPETTFDSEFTSKISSLGANVSYVVQNGVGAADYVIPIASDQELWVYRGYNTVGGDGLTYRYNPHIHRPYKAYILTETGSGIPGFPYSPTGSALSQFTIGTNTLLPISADISGKYIESKQAILGNLQQTNVNGVTEQLSPLAVSSSFIIYDDSRDIHPFIWTSYDTLPFPPAAGASFNVYKQNITEFEIIMDSKSRNKYNIKNKELINYNRKKLYETKKKDWDLEQKIKDNKINLEFKSSIRLPDEDLNNWDDPL